MKRSILLVGLVALTSGCGDDDSKKDETTSTGGAPPSAGGQVVSQSGGGPSGGVPTIGGTASGGAVGFGGATSGGALGFGGATSGGAVGFGGATSGGALGFGGATSGGAVGFGGATTGGTPSGGTGAVNTGGGTSDTGGVSVGGNPPGGGTAGSEAGSSGQATQTGGGENGGAAAGGQSGDAGQAGSQAGGGSSAQGGVTSNCVGNVIPVADPAQTGPFEVATEKNVGPYTGVVPDPVYGDKQQQLNVYYPANIEQSEYCHPILIWANGYRDNPEENPPDCIIDHDQRWCGQYHRIIKHLASHGFVVVAPLSTATREGDPLPTIESLDWILEQAEDSSSRYYHHLDTANIGQFGHSYGGMSTCFSASEPRYKALMTICGAEEPVGVHTPMLFYCGGSDTMALCDPVEPGDRNIREVFHMVTDQPALFLKEHGADHGSWAYGEPNSPSLSAAAAWFRAHLVNDTESRGFFYGSGCRFCSDNRVEVEQNSLMAE